MQKVDTYGECPQCGDSQHTDYIGETGFICCACCIVWTQIGQHEDYTSANHPYFADWYYVCDIEASEDALGQFDPCPSDS